MSSFLNYNSSYFVVHLMINYFAYGSNMDVSRLLARGVHFTSRKPVYLKNAKLTFDKIANFKNRTGFATIELANRSKVEGILYTIYKEGEFLLDGFEGYPYHYQKWEVLVYDENHQAHRAITYIAHPNYVFSGLRPTQEYLNHLLAGRDCLSEKYYEKLLKIDIFQKKTDTKRTVHLFDYHDSI